MLLESVGDREVTMQTPWSVVKRAMNLMLEDLTVMMTEGIAEWQCKNIHAQADGPPRNIMLPVPSFPGHVLKQLSLWR